VAKSLLAAVLALLACSLGAADGVPERRFWGSARTREPGPGLLAAQRVDAHPEILLERYPPARYNVYTIDLDQDGAPDFIVESKKEWETRFVKSDLSRDGWNKLNASLSDGFAYLYFARLDRDLLKLFFLAGDEDYSDFSLRELDPETWKLKTVMPVLPLLDSDSPERRGIYWAYPWDIRGLPLKTADGKVRILAAFKHRIASGQDETPRPGVPAILFTGIATQGEKTGLFDALRPKFSFMSLREILARRAQALRPRVGLRDGVYHEPSGVESVSVAGKSVELRVPAPEHRGGRVVTRRYEYTLARDGRLRFTASSNDDVFVRVLMPYHWSWDGERIVRTDPRDGARRGLRAASTVTGKSPGATAAVIIVVLTGSLLPAMFAFRAAS